MDADTKRALADENRRMERAYQRVLEREQTFPQLLNDGLCTIVELVEDVFPPAIATAVTNLGEKLVVFDRDVLTVLKMAQRSGRIVRTQLRRTNGCRCCWRATLLPPANWRGPFACAWCGEEAKAVVGGWDCPSCHARMPLEL